jgi:phosphatidylserine/phosphatidylglycerophosphate/cardiolipin synthase-like enzyme
MSHTLIVLPDDTVSAILEPINAAKRALNIRMFLFTEPTLLRAVIAAHQRGANVRVPEKPFSLPESRCAIAAPPLLSRTKSRWLSTTR